MLPLPGKTFMAEDEGFEPPSQRTISYTYGGLHCGQTLQILTAEHGWTPTRIEYDSRYDDPAQDFYGDRGWYLVGMESITSLSGRIVRIRA